MHTEKYLNKAIDIFKGLAFLLLTAGFGIASYVVTNLHVISPTQIIISGVGLSFLLVCLCFIVHRLKKMMDALDKLEKK